MTISFDFDDERLIVREKAAGSITREEYIENLAALEAELSVGAKLRVLSDFREVDQMMMSTDDLREMKSATNAALMAQRASARVAVVVSSKLHFGLARMYSMMQDSPELEVAVFMDVGEAEVWLGID